MILFDEDQPLARPFNRFFSVFLLRDGLFSPLERFLRATERIGTEIQYFHADAEFAALRAAQYGWKVCAAADAASSFRLDFVPARLLSEMGERIVADLQFCDLERRVPDRFPGVHFLGQDFFIHADVEILPGSVLDSRSGPIVLDQGVKVSPFSYAEGPLYAAVDARLDNVRLTGGVILGRSVRVGGEIENSIVGDFSNKHHEGFLGHSIAGRWVNLGALTTTSDLKNNYGPVRFRLPLQKGAEMLTVDSGTIKMGSLLGDCVKTAIGTMLSTGTVVDAGACILGPVGNYVKPLSWGNDAFYDPERFVSDAGRIFPRRKENPPAEFLALARLAMRGNDV